MIDGKPDASNSANAETTDRAYRALANEHRRRLLVALLERDPREDPPICVPEDVHDGRMDLDTLRVEMYHMHLPVLEDAGFIEWNREEHTVVEGPAFDVVELLLEQGPDESDDG